jgi:hypothetical protein
MTRHPEIISDIRSGDPTAALAKLEPLLAAEPQDSELLSIKALALAESGRPDDAVDTVRHALRNAVTPAQKFKHVGNLAQLLARVGRWQEVSALTNMDLPSVKAVPEMDFDAGSFVNLCSPLLAAGEHLFVTEFLSACIDRPGSSWELEHVWLKAVYKADRFATILTRIDSPSYRWRDKAEATAIACAAAVQLQQKNDSSRLYAVYLSAAPPYVSPHSASQIMSIAVISPNPRINSLTLPLVRHHFQANFPHQIRALTSNRYRFFSVFLGSSPGPIAELVGGEPAITLNNCVNGESLKSGDLTRVEQHEKALGLPVINAAAKAFHCTRLETAEMLRGIPNLIVPKIMRFRLDTALVPVLRMRIKDLFAYPVILRSVGHQEASNLYLAANDRELDAALSALLALNRKDFYVIDFLDTKHAGGYYRRIRAAFVGGEPEILRADFADEWIVKGRKYERIQALYGRKPELLHRADDIVNRPDQLGQAAWSALLEVGRRIPLDVFGLDFDVDGSGRVIFFESNATMNLLSNAPPQIDYPADAQRAFLGGLDRLFLQRSGIVVH